MTDPLPPGIREAAVPMSPPTARKVPSEQVVHGRTIRDDYAWLRDPEYPQVRTKVILDYLEAENEYFDAAMSPYKGLKETLIAEMKGRMPEEDASVPARDGPFEYWWRYAKGAEYRTWLRRPAGKEDPEEIILDEAEQANSHDFYALGGLALSPDHRMLAFSEDVSGSERFTLKIRDLDTGKELAEDIPDTIGHAVWSADGKGFFYLLVNENWRPHKVLYHRLGDGPGEDRLVYEEKDPSFFVGLSRSQSRKYLFIASGDHVTNEVRFLPLGKPGTQPVLIAPREGEHEYEVDHAEGHFFIRTNDTHRNFRLVKTPEKAPAQDNWREILPASDDRHLTGLVAFKSFLAVEGQEEALDQMWILDHDGDGSAIGFDEPVYTVSLGSNAEYAPDRLRLAYESLVTPASIFDYDLKDKRLVCLKTAEIPSGYAAESYVCERLWAPARDGERIPVSIVYRKDFKRDGTGPLHLYGYGAYSIVIPPGFSSHRLSLLDRGFAFAIAHVRGGGEFGHRWYEGGKRDKRITTFHDFIDAAEFLIAEGYGAKGRVSASGGSAGGKLMGYIANERPDLWAGLAAHVPFVDVLNTMLDDTLPLTPIEWPEWGNPLADAAAFDLLRGYSPYENVKAQAYPPILVTAGLNDPRVTYWEPAKWVARLRAVKTNDALVLLKTNMGAGHRGKTGRYRALEEKAEEYLFLLMAFGLTDRESQEN